MNLSCLPLYKEETMLVLWKIIKLTCTILILYYTKRLSPLAPYVVTSGYFFHSAYFYILRNLLKGKATFEAHFKLLPIASYSLLWYPLAINYDYLNPLLFNYYTHFALRRIRNTKFLLKQTVQIKQFLWSNPSYTTVPSHCFSKGAIIG